MTLTDLLIPTYCNMLHMLRRLLDKAEAQLGPEKAQALLSARLAPDMFPLSTQLRFAAVQAMEAPLRLMGEPLPQWHEEVLNEGRDAGDRPGTLEEARARLIEALTFVDSLDDDALDQAAGDRPMILELPSGMTFDLTREQFARDWALGQFQFHVVAAYAILRHHGVAIGKADYVPHMFGYLRADAEPAA